tara:strand:- start:42 stop:206 length:165 start_codon:yes stop_codon:yes gene_type:complete
MKNITLNLFQINVIQVALDHLREMHSDLLGEEVAQDKFHQQVIDTCDAIQLNLK